MIHEHHTAEESGAILERLRIQDELDDVAARIRAEVSYHGEAAHVSTLCREFDELTAQLAELDS